MYPLNDAGSIEVDPSFVNVDPNNPEDSDLRLKPGSHCLNTGKRTVAGGYSDIGAWQGISLNIMVPEDCTGWLAMDFNYDCKVDFQDFGIFALSWLEDNRE